MDTGQTNPDLKPKVDPHRRTTKVNIGVFLGVLVFLVVAFTVVVMIQRNPKETVEQEHRRVENSQP